MKQLSHRYSETPFDLTGRTAVISGGAGLLGREFCKALVSADCQVVLADIDEALGTEAFREIKDEFPDCTVSVYSLDVTDSGSIREFVNSVKEEFNAIDILVNSAAVDPKFERDSDTSGFSEFSSFPREYWNESIEVNLTGTFLLTQKVTEIMEGNGKGSIINLGSNYGLVGPDQRIYHLEGQPGQTYKPVVYSVCKAGIIGFTKYLAAYYAGTDIRVNVLTPSGVYNNHDEEFVKKYSTRTILRRMSKKNEFWGGVIFLASDASSYMTGANLVIDGGWTAL